MLSVISRNTLFFLFNALGLRYLLNRLINPSSRRKEIILNQRIRLSLNHTVLPNLSLPIIFLIDNPTILNTLFIAILSKLCVHQFLKSGRALRLRQDEVDELSDYCLGLGDLH